MIYIYTIEARDVGISTPKKKRTFFSNSYISPGVTQNSHTSLKFSHLSCFWGYLWSPWFKQQDDIFFTPTRLHRHDPGARDLSTLSHRDHTCEGWSCEVTRAGWIGWLHRRSFRRFDSYQRVGFQPIPPAGPTAPETWRCDSACEPCSGSETWALEHLCSAGQASCMPLDAQAQKRQWKRCQLLQARRPLCTAAARPHSCFALQENDCVSEHATWHQDSTATVWPTMPTSCTPSAMKATLRSCCESSATMSSVSQSSSHSLGAFYEYEYSMSKIWDLGPLQPRLHQQCCRCTLLPLPLRPVKGRHEAHRLTREFQQIGPLLSAES